MIRVECMKCAAVLEQVCWFLGGNDQSRAVSSETSRGRFVVGWV